MEVTPLLRILRDMRNTDKELDLLMLGESQPIQLRNLVNVEDIPQSPTVLKITTEQNYIWLDANHVSACYQARADI